MNKQKNITPEASHEWMGPAKVYAKLGGMIGVHEVRRLMKENHIRSWWVRGKLMTTSHECEKWMKAVENSPKTPHHCGVGYIVPVAALQAQ